jgi:hypothetical protein
VLADYTVSLADQPLSTRTREAYLAAVTAFLAWLGERDSGPGDALAAPRARDLAARDYKRHMRVERGLILAAFSETLDPIRQMGVPPHPDHPEPPGERSRDGLVSRAGGLSGGGFEP